MQTDNESGLRPRTPRRSWLVLAVIVLAQGAAAALQLGLPAIAPALRHEFDLTGAELAVLLAAGPAGLALSVFGWGVLADCVGPRRVLVSGMMIAAAALAAASRAGTFEVLVGLVLVAAIGGSPAHAAGAKVLVSRFPRHRHGLALGIRHTAIPLGGAVAAITLPRAVSVGGVERALLLVAAGFAVAAIVVAMLLESESVEGEVGADAGSVRGGVDRALANRPLLLLGGGGSLLVLAQLALASYLVLYLHDVRRWSVADAAVVLAATQVVGGGGRIALGALSDRLGIRVALMQTTGVIVSVTLAVLALPIFDGGAVVLIAAAAAVSNAWNGVAYAAAADLAMPNAVGASLGVQTTIFALAGFAAPLAAGWLIHAADWHLTFLVLAVVAAASALVLEQARRTHPPVHASASSA